MLFFSLFRVDAFCRRYPTICREFYCWKFRDRTVKRRVCCTSIQIPLHMPDTSGCSVNVYFIKSKKPRCSQFPTWCRSSSHSEPSHATHTNTHTDPRHTFIHFCNVLHASGMAANKNRPEFEFNRALFFSFHFRFCSNDLWKLESYRRMPDIGINRCTC